ncbi:MAG: hypothetical protein F6J93_34115 [Oscillatoria sp. SIO1A7]|nr:hypothetical protein [Oscillatoria sp. SIO1A7]
MLADFPAPEGDTGNSAKFPHSFHPPQFPPPTVSTPHTLHPTLLIVLVDTVEYLANQMGI